MEWDTVALPRTASAIQNNSALNQGRSRQFSAQSTPIKSTVALTVMAVLSNLESNRLELRSDLCELKRLAEWVKAWTELSADTSFAIQLCLEEAVANIIMYGGVTTEDRPKIAIELKRNGETLVARIEDTGSQFDPTQFAPQPLAKSLEEAKVDGIGIRLMRSFASDMQYERRDGRNRLTLRFVELH
jgi:serine/threonine-protein kinase RsbW